MQRLDLLIELRGELIDTLGETDPGEDGADLNQRHDHHRERDDAEKQLAGFAHTWSPRSRACWNASRPRSTAVTRFSRWLR